jgi:hypothetical protein
MKQLALFSVLLAALLVAACTPVDGPIIVEWENNSSLPGMVGAWDDTKSAGSSFTASEYNTMVQYIKTQRATTGTVDCAGEILEGFTITGSAITPVCVPAGAGTVTGSGLAPSYDIYKVALWSSTSALTADSVLCWNSTSNMLGVGTCTPGSAADVNGGLAFGGNISMFNQPITGVKTYTHYDTYSNGGSGAARTVDWYANGASQSITLDAATTFTFTAPPGDARLMLIVKQDATGSRTASWPANVKWPGGTAPTLTTTGGATDMITCWYDGTNYFCGASLNFA